MNEVTILREEANKNVVEHLEYLLERAKAGEIRAVATAWEYFDGTIGHQASFGNSSNRTLMVGKLEVLQQHIILNECLEWKPA